MKKLTEELRAILKKPLGKLTSNAEAVYSALEAQKSGRLLICIGDSCSWEMISAGVKPVLIVYDNLCKRVPTTGIMREGLDAYNGKPVVVKNPAGYITDELEEALETAIALGKGKILVDGEEDLAALPAIIKARMGTLVIYGQPGEGVVLVNVTEESKKKAVEICARMEVI